MQHRRAHKIPHIGIHPVQDTPLETLQKPPSVIPRNVVALENLLRLAGSASDLLPAFEEIFAGEHSAFHVFVEEHGELQGDGLQGAGDVGDADGGGLGED